MVETVNQLEIRVIGMARSGNHAVIDWIRAGAAGRVCFLNCCEGKTNPFQSARPMDGGAVVLATENGRESAWLDLEGERRGRFARKDLLIHNYEDSFLGHACSDEFERRHDEWVGASAERVDVLILRDPYNLFASRLGRKDLLVRPATALRIWRQHAAQFAGRPTRLPARPVLLNYNRWVASAEYRERVAGAIGVRNRDAALDRVPAVCGGSSFDGTAYDGRGRRMRVLERWRAYADDPGFRALFDGRTVALADDVFGEIPGVAAWLGEDGPRRRRAG